MGYSIRRQDSDLYLPTVQTILAGYFHCPDDQIRTSTFLEDVKQATDLVTPGDHKIAVRVRSSKYKPNFFGQFTVRTSAGKDGLSELSKLQSCKADYIFYGFHSDDDGKTLTDWWLMSVCCSTFRYPIGDLTNGYDSTFRAFWINAGVVVASSLNYPFGTCN